MNWTRRTALAAVVCFGAGSAGTQPEPGNEGTRCDLTGFTARAVERVALLDLRAAGTPGAGDFVIAYEVLGLAQKLDPGNVEIVRRRAEAAWNAGDRAGLLEMSRRVVELDPADTVAQLRLITARIGALQTAEERLAMYGAFLGEKGEAIDPSVRSRLALDAALTCRERGDEEGFAERLKQALMLDSTNKDAALLAYTYFAQRVEDPRGRLDLLSNLLMADPLDFRTVRSIRDECAGAGAYEAARRFQRFERGIMIGAGRAPDQGFDIEGFVLEWAVEGAGAVVKTLTMQVEAERAKVQFAAEMDPTRLEGPNVMRPEDIRLDMAFEQIRALALASQGESVREAMMASVIDLERTVQNRIQAYADPIRRPGTMSEMQAMDLARAVLLELHMLRMMIGVQQPEQMVEMETFSKGLPEDDYKIRSSRAWKAVHENRPDDALAIEAQETPNAWLDVAHAEAMARKGSVAGAIRAYSRARARNPLNVLGMWCRTRIKALGGDPAGDAAAGVMTEAAGAIPEWVDNMLQTPRLTQAMSAEVAKTSLKALDHQPVRVRLRNVSSVPMGLGSGRAMNSRLFFGPMLEIGARARNDQAVGEVVEVDRRLRLLPGEELEVMAWPEAGLVGYLAEVASDRPSRVRWRVIQGFETRQEGNREAGPGCVEASTPAVSREALPESRLPLQMLVDRIEASKEESELGALLVASRSRLMGGAVGGAPIPESEAFGKFLAEKYAGWTPLGRLAAAAVFPPSSICPALAPLDAAIKADSDEGVRLIAAATRTVQAEDALLSAMSAGEGPGGRVARAQSQRLQSGGATYSRVGPLSGPKRQP